MKLKPLVFGLLLMALVAIGVGYFFFTIIFQSNVPDNLTNEFVEIQPNTSFEALTEQLTQKNQILDQQSFQWVAQLMKFDKSVPRNGRFKIKPSWSNRTLISHLRIGEQDPVNVIFHSDRTVKELAGTVANVMAFDSISLSKFLTQSDSIAILGYDSTSIMTIFIPNTYQLYWNTSISKFLKRMEKEKNIFWSNHNRIEKAKKIGLSLEKIYTLASIVEKETNKNVEKQRVAGVYMNRLKKGMLLQADPTVVFANKDFTIKRVLKKHLEKDSPYNTYKYTGLPPGPISMASISSIDAVLNYENHKYLYFCAKPDNSGLHAFAKTLSQHNSNARKYHKWLKANGY